MINRPLGPSPRGGGAVSGLRGGDEGAALSHTSRGLPLPHPRLTPAGDCECPNPEALSSEAPENNPDYPWSHASAVPTRAQTRRCSAPSAQRPLALSPLELPPKLTCTKEAISARRKPLKMTSFQSLPTSPWWLCSNCLGRQYTKGAGLITKVISRGRAASSGDASLRRASLQAALPPPESSIRTWASC